METPHDKIKRLITACIVSDFENDAGCEQILRRLEDRIMEVVLVDIADTHRVALAVVEASRDFWYRQYKHLDGTSQRTTGAHSP